MLTFYGKQKFSSKLLLRWALQWSCHLTERWRNYFINPVHIRAHAQASEMLSAMNVLRNFSHVGGDHEQPFLAQLDDRTVHALRRSEEEDGAEKTDRAQAERRGRTRV